MRGKVRAPTFLKKVIGVGEEFDLQLSIPL
jgi:hypothetical protein